MKINSDEIREAAIAFAEDGHIEQALAEAVANAELTEREAAAANIDPSEQDYEEGPKSRLIWFREQLPKEPLDLTIFLSKATSVPEPTRSSGLSSRRGSVGRHSSPNRRSS